METCEDIGNNAFDLPSFLDRLPVAAYTCDVAGLITYYNKHAIAIWGREPAINDSSDRFCGSFKLLAPDGTPIPHKDCWMGLALKNERQYDGEEIVIERQDGSRATVLAHANPLYDGSGKLAGAVNVLVDISERKGVLDGLKLADLRKNEFLATLSHEMRSPLAAVLNSLLVISQDDLSTATRRVVEIMDRQIRHLVGIVDDLIDVSRITFGRLDVHLETTSLVPVLEAAVETSRPLVEERGHTVVWDIPNGPIFLSADPVRLTQVFCNLITNAAKYTPCNGMIGINVHLSDGTVQIKIIDDGVGIPTEMQEHIFEKFVQVNSSSERAPGGLGIGLNVARQLTNLHGGDIKVFSDGEGKGCTFTVELPTVGIPTAVHA